MLCHCHYLPPSFWAPLWRRRSQFSSYTNNGPACCLVWDWKNACTEFGIGQ